MKVDISVRNLNNFEFWDYYSPINHELIKFDVSGIPFVTYPDGRSCYELNVFLLEQVKLKNLSLRVKGGTARTNAFELVHLIRFCWTQAMNLTQLNDDYFTLFINYLMAERDIKGERVRGNNRVISIGRKCLEFLEFVQNINGVTNFIGEGRENSIVIVHKEHKVAIDGTKNKKIVITVHHQALPSSDSKKKKKPISKQGAAKLWESIGEESPDKMARDSLIFQLLEQVGGRRTEVAWITVDHIEESYRSATGETAQLKLITLKQKDEEDNFRSIPVPMLLINEARKYIRKVRKKILKAKVEAGSTEEHNLLLISLTTGKPFKPDSITGLVNDWSRKCGLIENVHPHLFRHAYITFKLKEIILEHNEINSKDDFRRLLLNTERFKTMLKEWTGHSSSYSLDTYIDLVFDDLAQTKSTYKAVILSAAVKMAEQKIERLELSLFNKSITPFEVLLQAKHMLEFLKYDIESSKT